MRARSYSAINASYDSGEPSRASAASTTSGASAHTVAACSAASHRGC
ncbi:MAG: hypothetical protein QM723_23475 [Myxococcaceae bacterium]